ncbi:MAG: DUF1513 domain-containing protein [Rhizobiaceae bacterium]
MARALIDRRDFLRAAGLGFAASLTPVARARAQSADAVFATAYQRRDGAFGAAILTDAGAILKTIDLPDRGHDVTFDPVFRRSVVFARQPGTFMVVFDHAGDAPPVTIASTQGRHFFGHGVFSRGGRLLYATENDFDQAAGMVGVYDATDGFRRIGEFPTHGVGPHELLLMPDGNTLAVCNGGIETHPDFGAAKLNIATMEPSFVLIDRRSGDLVEKHVLPREWHKLSIRHMDLDEDGAVWFGCQHEGPAMERPALVGRAVPGEPLEMIEMPDEVLSGFRNYIGSVAANRQAGTVAVSSPQGNQWAVIDAATGKVLGTERLVEVCGLAPAGPGFVATTGGGLVRAPDGTLRENAAYVWDNHLLRIEALEG